MTEKWGRDWVGFGERGARVPVQKQNELLETQNCKSSGITEKFVRVCKDTLIPS